MHLGQTLHVSAAFGMSCSFKRLHGSQNRTFMDEGGRLFCNRKSGAVWCHLWHCLPCRTPADRCPNDAFSVVTAHRHQAAGRGWVGTEHWSHGKLHMTVWGKPLVSFQPTIQALARSPFSSGSRYSLLNDMLTRCLMHRLLSLPDHEPVRVGTPFFLPYFSLWCQAHSR